MNRFHGGETKKEFKQQFRKCNQNVISNVYVHTSGVGSGAKGGTFRG